MDAERPPGAEFAHLFEGVAAPAEAHADGDALADGVLRPAEDGAGEVGFRRADKGFRFGLAQADAEVLDSHAGVDEHDHGAGLEQGEREGVELQARRRHQYGANAAADADAFEAGGEAVGFGVEFAEGEMAVAVASEAVAGARLHDGQ